MSAFDALCDSLDRVRVRGNSASARCPSHEDRSASLSLARKNDRTLLHCFAGCTPEEVLAAVGMNLRDLFDDTDGYRREYTPMRPKPDHELIPSVEHLLDRMARQHGIESTPGYWLRRADDFAKVGTPEADQIAEAVRNMASLVSTNGPGFLTQFMV